MTLQTLDPIWVDFFIPQQQLIHIGLKQTVNVVTNTYPGKQFKGLITTINPLVDPTTRNVQVEATAPNPKHLLLPGMFSTVFVKTGNPVRYITLPQTAISYNSYGDIIYILKQKNKNKKSKPEWIANQSFVKVGEKRGDQIAILSGVKAGDLVVVAGQLKLHNGMPVTINNSVLPSNNPAPKVIDR